MRSIHSFIQTRFCVSPAQRCSKRSPSPRRRHRRRCSSDLAGNPSSMDSSQSRSLSSRMVPLPLLLWRRSYYRPPLMVGCPLHSLPKRYRFLMTTLASQSIPLPPSCRRIPIPMLARTCMIWSCFCISRRIRGCFRERTRTRRRWRMSGPQRRPSMDIYRPFRRFRSGFTLISSALLFEVWNWILRERLHGFWFPNKKNTGFFEEILNLQERVLLEVFYV